MVEQVVIICQENFYKFPLNFFPISVLLGHFLPGESWLSVGVGDNVSFHHSNIIRQCFATHVILIDFLPYSPFLNPIDKFFFLISSIEMESTWSPATYTDDPSGSNGSACHDISADACRSWITEQAHHRYSLWSGWEFVTQQTSTSGHRKTAL